MKSTADNVSHHSRVFARVTRCLEARATTDAGAHPAQVDARHGANCHAALTTCEAILQPNKR